MLIIFFEADLYSQDNHNIFAKEKGIGTNYRIHPSSSNQTEVFITTHPLNSSIMFSSANTVVFQPTYFVSEGVYVTTNAGNSWFGSDTCKGANVQFHGGDPGIAIDKDGRFILTRLARSPLQGLYSHYSTDFGNTWSSQFPIATDFLERASVITDGDPTSLFFGRTYAAWVRFTPPFPLFTSYTTNGGESWLTSFQVNNPSQRCAGGELAIANGGKLYACWAGVETSSPFAEKYVGFASSINGGNNWTVNENIFATQGIRGTLPQKQNIRVDGLPRMDVDKSGGSRDGWIYIVTTQKNLSPAGSDPDIIFNKSTDSGLTWSQSTRVNQDALNNGKIQYFPAIHVDKFGGINIIFYDDRNTTSDSSGVFLARSVDGGDTWIEYEISDHNFKPAAISGLPQGYQGDNIGLTSSNNTLWPVWMDNSSGIYQIWTVPIDLIILDVEKTENLPTEFELYQNYPNPFNPNTIIRYKIPLNPPLLKGESEAGRLVTLKVFDVLGNEVVVLVNEEKPAGEYEVEFQSSVGSRQFASGIYFYQLKSGKFSETKKMMILK
ncbi:MAG: hypothetical protein A2V93_02710 [Ignavibacteria bacterium RBG_16_34_14]|nr:MAG: hypothetical protein A2V93_02710 [Ignavibacteria bacterium RBG_16_34_14]